MMKGLTALLMVGALALSACSGSRGGDEDVLQLRGLDISADDWQRYARQLLLDPGADAFCSGLRGLSPEEVADTLASDEDIDVSLIPGATPRPGQTPAPDDRIRAAQTLKDECERILR